MSNARTFVSLGQRHKNPTHAFHQHELMATGERVVGGRE